MQRLKRNGEDGTMNNSVYYKATDEDGNIILRHGWKQNLEDGAARKRNQQAREDYVRANRLKKVRKVIKEVKRLTKPGTPYKGPTSAFQAQEIQKDKERQKLAKELKNRKIAEQNRRAREKAANINRRQKTGKAYMNNLTK